jgi:methionyl-tRNA formyltransferase
MSKIVVFAYSLIGHDCLKFLIENGETISAVFTHDDNPQEYIWFPSVKKLCDLYQIPYFTPLKPNTLEIIQQVQDLAPDLIFSFYYRQMIPQRILDIPPKGAFNMHGSLLPKYRGRSPINWAILKGEAKTGATLHYMVKSADAGDIVDQEAIPITVEDNALTVTEKVRDAAILILKRQINPLKNGTAPRLIQDSCEASYFGGRTAEDGRIDWSWSARDIYNLVRAVSPQPHFPPAFAELNGKIVSIKQARFTFQDQIFSAVIPGSIVKTAQDNFLEIACGSEGTERILIRV